MKGGLPETVPAFTVNKVCGSGLKSIQLAYQSIVTGENDIVLAGGMERICLNHQCLSTTVALVLKWDINQWLIAWYMMV